MDTTKNCKEENNMKMNFGGLCETGKEVKTGQEYLLKKKDGTFVLYDELGGGIVFPCRL
jgi:uncharacterized phage-like protein YoqJ